MHRTGHGEPCSVQWAKTMPQGQLQAAARQPARPRTSQQSDRLVGCQASAPSCHMTTKLDKWPGVGESRRMSASAVLQPTKPNPHLFHRWTAKEASLAGKLSGLRRRTRAKRANVSVAKLLTEPGEVERGVSREIRARFASELNSRTSRLKSLDDKGLHTLASTAATVFGWRDRDRAPAVRLSLGKVDIATGARPIPQPVVSCGVVTEVQATITPQENVSDSDYEV